MIFDSTLTLSSFLPTLPNSLTIGGMTLMDFAMRVGLALLLGSLIGATNLRA